MGQTPPEQRLRRNYYKKPVRILKVSIISGGPWEVNLPENAPRELGSTPKHPDLNPVYPHQSLSSSTVET